MQYSFDCPICKKNQWEHIETYLYSKEDGSNSSQSRIFSVLSRLKLIARILLFAKPRKNIVTCGSLSTYQKLRWKVIFNVWFKDQDEVKVRSLHCAGCGFVCYTPRPDDNDIARKRLGDVSLAGHAGCVNEPLPLRVPGRPAPCLQVHAAADSHVSLADFGAVARQD